MISRYLGRAFGINDLNLCLLIAGSVCFIPFCYSRATIDPVLTPRFLILAGVTALLVAGVLVEVIKDPSKYDFDIIFRAAFLLAVGYLLAAAVSLLHAVNLAEGIFEWLKIFLFYSYLFVSTLIISAHKGSLPRLTEAVAAMCLVLAAIGVLQYFKIAFNDIPGNYLIYATMANRNLNSSALFLTLPFTVYGVYRFGSVWYALCCAAAAGSIYVITLNGTRTVWVALLFSGLITGLTAYFTYRKRTLPRKEKSDLRNRSLFLLAVVIAAASGAALTPKPTNYPPAVVTESQPAVSPEARLLAPQRPVMLLDTLKERFLLWEKSIQMARENPLIGAGIGQWKILLPSYGKIDKYEDHSGELTEIQFVRPHNDFIWVLAENGLAGVMAYLGFFVVLIIYALRSVWQSPDSDRAFFALMMFFGIMGYMIIAFFSFPKERIFHSVFLMLMAAAVISIYHEVFPGTLTRTSRNQKRKLITKVRKHEKERNQISCFRYSMFPWLKNFAAKSAEIITKRLKFKLPIRTAFAAVVGIMLIFSLFVGIVRFNSEAHTRNALAARQSENPEAVISEIDKAASWFYSLDPTSTPLMWYRGMANFQLGHREKALEDFKKAYEHHPNHIHVLNNLGTCYALLKQPEKARRILSKSIGYISRI